MDDFEDGSIIKSLNDRRDYRVITLENGLTALLISDVGNQKGGVKDPNDMVCDGSDDDDSSGSDSDGSETMEFSDTEAEQGNKKCCSKETKLAAGALCVGVGSFCDPAELSGLAHFLEHMVFMGSEKYPDENSFDAFIQKHGGSTNAFTDCERTVFTFDIRPKYLKETLDRFAQFFISPLMKRNSVERETMAVESEFQMNYQSDQARKMQLLGSFTTADHPFGKFLWGSEETLKTTPEKMGIDVYERLQSFWKKMYSSHYMTLAVISNEELNSMENWVRDIFKSIPKNDSPRPNFQDCKSTFDESKFYKLYKVVPVKDLHQLEINWVFPCLEEHYRAKPINYVSWLLGHEGEGSVLALLKEKGWATALSCGNSGGGQEFNSLYSLFACTVNLTASGLVHYLECITIIFQYLEMLRQVGPNPRIFSEIKQTAENSFRFKDEVDPVEYVEEIAECMQRYPARDFLTGRHLVWDLDEKMINYVQSNLVPEKANVMLLSKSFACHCTEKEKWFGTQYSSEVFDDDVTESWKNLSLHPDLHLPKENTLIATNFDIILCETSLQYPVIVHECAKGKVWHKQDQTFLVPKARYYFCLKSPTIVQSAEMLVLAELYCLLLNFDLKHLAYEADVAGLFYGISVTDYGMQLSFCGFNHKLPVFFHKVVEHMFSFHVSEIQFNVVKEQLTRVYYNRIIKPQNLVRNARLKILQEVKWTDVDKRRVIDNITLEKLKEFPHVFKSRLYVESLFQGNLTAKDAAAHQNLVYRNFGFESLPVTCRPQVRVLQLPEGESICKINGYNKNDQNTVITNYYQIGPATSKDLTYTNLLLYLMEEPCFDNLRTKQQLGYSVYCTPRETFGILGYSLTLQTQAEKFSSNFVKERMDVFLMEFLESFKTSDSTIFQNHVTSMIKIKEHDDLNLREEASRNWREITENTYVFDRLNKEIGYLKELTKEMFIEWIHDTASVEKNRKLSVQILGHKLQDDSSDEACRVDETWSLTPLLESEVGATCISDIEHFKASLYLYPVSKFN